MATETRGIWISQKIQADRLAVFLKIAYRVSRDKLADYSNKYSPRRFTQSQVMACLLLREYLTLDLRILEQLIASQPSFKKILQLNAIPDHSTFCRHMKRISKKTKIELLNKTARLLPKSW